MESTKFMDRLPPVSDHLALATLAEVLRTQVHDQVRDFTANPRPDHPLVYLVMLLKWLGDLPPGPDGHRLRWVK